MTKKYTLYIVPHTHWDREWYGSFQLFRIRLVRLMNKLLNLLEQDPDYKTFNLDGQTIILEDYLEVHPEQREKLIQLVSEGRLKVGPWYILPDEFLTSGESMVRNLLLGKQMSQEFGHRMDVGYIPDTFGHIAQLPQILQGFGLDTCMNFRGLDSGNRQSELWWQSPDGSQVLLHHMSTEIGYSDLGAMAENPQRAAYDLRATAYYKAERATGNVVLAMQGVDHVEAREDLSQIINIANDTFDDVEFVHASLEDFWSALKKSVADKDLETVYGELRDVPRTINSMNFLLYNVLSSRVDNKIQNAQTLLSLENWAEPWCTLVWMLGVADYPHGHLWTAWKWLLKNHPHDSIGGCSVDEVHRQMTTRFEWAKEIADYLVEERFRLIAEQVNFSSANHDELAVMIFNASPWERDEVITIDIDLPEYWLRQQAISQQAKLPELNMNSHFREVIAVNTRADWLYGMPTMPEVFFRGIDIRPIDGEAIPVQIHYIEQTTTALALASGPRGVMDIRRVRASFWAKVPAHGYTTYYVKTRRNPSQWQAETAPNTLQNEHLKVEVQPNGTFDLTIKTENESYTYCGLGLLEDSGDNGDGYTFSPPPTNRIYTTKGANPRIAQVGTGVGLQQIRIEYALELPVGLNDNRQKRRDEMVTCPIIVDLILRDGSQHLEIAIEIDNCAKDHRLRMHFPTGLQGIEEASSAMQFDVMTRPIKPQPIQHGEWWVENPPETFPMHGWMDVDDTKWGLGVIAEGLYEFAVDNINNSAEIAITLLRSVGYLGARRDLTTIIGGAGPGIPTPEAQLQSKLTYRMALYPHKGTWQEAEVGQQAQSFLTPPRAITIVPHEGERAAVQQGFTISGKNVVISAIKQSEDQKATIIRLYNPTYSTRACTVKSPIPIHEAVQTNLQEDKLEQLTIADSKTITVDIPAKTITTIRFVFQQDDK